MNNQPNLASVLQALAETSGSPAVHPTTNHAQIPFNIAPISAQPPPVRLPDPTTITKWSIAVKYVTTNILTDSVKMERLGKMKHHQNQHERLWWDNREALLKRHEADAQNKAKLAGILKSFGQNEADAQELTIEEKNKELKQYDGKVYQALTRMVQEMSNDMKVMKIPFFCVVNEQDFDGGKVELRKMQTKMLGFLFDLLD